MLDIPFISALTTVATPLYVLLISAFPYLVIALLA